MFSEELGFTTTGSSLSAVITLLAAIALIPPLGALSDRVGCKPLLAAPCIGFALPSYPLFLLMNQGSIAGAVLAHVALGALLAEA